MIDTICIAILKIVSTIVCIIAFGFLIYSLYKMGKDIDRFDYDL